MTGDEGKYPHAIISFLVHCKTNVNAL